MGDDDKNILDPSTASAAVSAPSASVNNVIELLYGSDDIQKAYPIPTGKISSIELKESIFTDLPTLKVKLNDVGTLFNTVGFQIGYTINVKITPVVKDKDTIPKPYVNAKFVIQSISYYLDQDKNDYLYELNCVYAAEKYLNDICVWPLTELDAANVTKNYTSEQVLNFICSRGGLKFVTELFAEPDDNMAWLNANLTYCEFAKYIVSHAWVADDDMPLLYVDKDGLAHFNSLNNLCNGAVKATYIQATLFDAKYRNKEPAGLKQNKKPYGYRTFNDIQYRNMGFIQNQGGYGVKTKIYNPYNIKELNPKIFIPDIPDNPKNTTANDACIRSKDFNDKKLRIASMGNKSPGQTDSYRYAFNKMHFQQTHQYYDYAPQHHESIKRSFFQQFIFITCDAPNQPDYEFDPQQKISLGDRITVRADSINDPGSIQSGDYLVASIVHNFYVNSNYTVIITGVNDGINGVGQLKKESEINRS